MPSIVHEGYVELIREEPALIADLLGLVGVRLPDHDSSRTESADLTEVVPTEYRADGVVVLTKRTGTDSGAEISPVDGEGGSNEPGSEGDTDRRVAAVVVEVQLRRDPRKRRTWPMYVASLHARMGCPSILLVICPNKEVAKWCARPIELGHPGLVLRPLVLCQDAVPVITDADVMRTRPALAVLSALTHASSPDADAIFKTLTETLRDFEDRRATLYLDLVNAVLPEAARKHLEELLSVATWNYQSPWAKKFVAVGEKRGEARGEARGKAQGEAEALLAVLDARGIEVPEDVAARVRACTDLEQLGRWVRRAVRVASVEELLGEPAAAVAP